jgi:hypothetical protein
MLNEERFFYKARKLALAVETHVLECGSRSAQKQMRCRKAFQFISSYVALFSIFPP